MVGLHLMCQVSLIDLPSTDVEEIPAAGTWFQLIANGTTKINDGPNGLQKLDTIMRLAEKHKIHILLSLTNNWNPGTNKTGRNTLSNDYGPSDSPTSQVPLS